MVKKLIHLIEKYEHYLSPGSLVLGFIIDSLTLKRADIFFDNFILLTYLLLSGICILILNANDAGRFRNERVLKITPLLPLVLQFAFGGLFSGFTVLYSRSSSLGASWPFIGVMASLLIGNEYFRNRYKRLVFQVAIYFIAIFSYLIFAIPILANEIGPVIFILSGGISLAIVGILVYFLILFAPQMLHPYKRTLILSVIGIYAAFNFLYFSNIIPPIPLVLKEVMIVHDLKHSGGNNLTMAYEPPKWYHLFKDFDPTYHRVGNEPVYAYSSIYAPADIGTTIIHEWSYFDEAKGKWILSSKLQYPIFGGREKGFRGYSLKTNITPGKWRVSIKTKHGQVLGRVKFDIVPASSEPNTQAVVK